MQDRYTRLRWLVGSEQVDFFAQQKVLVFGLGGVGGICVDALFRSGFKELTLVDSDNFEITNLNRQLHSEHLNQPKAKVFEKIYEAKGVVARVDEEFFKNFDLSEFDLIIDAIDDIPAKVLLANKVNMQRQIFISSTGGARKLDPSRVKIAPLYKTHGDALAKKFRYELKKTGLKGEFDVVFSDEKPLCKDLGSFMGVTACFGLTLASLALRKVLARF